jgi:hypothetical protein
VYTIFGSLLAADWLRAVNLTHWRSTPCGRPFSSSSTPAGEPHHLQPTAAPAPPPPRSKPRLARHNPDFGLGHAYQSARLNFFPYSIAHTRATDRPLSPKRPRYQQCAPHDPSCRVYTDLLCHQSTQSCDSPSARPVKGHTSRSTFVGLLITPSIDQELSPIWILFLEWPCSRGESRPWARLTLLHIDFMALSLRPIALFTRILPLPRLKLFYHPFV